MTPASVPLTSYLTRLIWLCVLPLLLLAAWLAFISLREQRADRHESATHLARNFATDVDYYLKARIGALSVLAASPLADDAARRQDFYREAQGFHGSFGSHVILADTGEPMRMLFNTRVAFGAPLPPLPKPQGRAAAPEAAATGKPVVGDTFFGPIAREPLVAVAVPVLRADKAGFVLATISETAGFQRRIEEVALPAGWSLALLDGRGETIARRAPAGADAPEDGAERFAFPSQVSNWSVVLEIPRDVHRAQQVSLAVALALGLAGATLIGVLGGTMASRRLGRAVAVLATADGSDAPQDIAEFEAVRRRLKDAALKRQQAEASRNEHALKLEALSRRLLHVQEDERRALAHELHDEIGQTLTALKLGLAALHRRLADATDAALLADSLALVDQTIGRIRDRSHDLRPPMLDDIGLAGTVEWHVGRLAGKVSLPITARIEALAERPAPEVEAAAFRMVEDALAAALASAGAERIALRLWQDDGVLCLTVAAEGAGLDAAGLAEDPGLADLRERAGLLGGEIMIDSSPERGTEVRVRLPLHPPRPLT